MAPRPDHDVVLLITHPGGGKSFDYADYWDGNDLIYTGRGKTGDQELKGANRQVADNSRTSKPGIEPETKPHDRPFELPS